MMSATGRLHQMVSRNRQASHWPRRRCSIWGLSTALGR
uniref:Uncharacterized protein n=1 Tax=Arundo donax TaxID=35708 RepID=A0A0A9ACJ6_ARUDO